MIMDASHDIMNTSICLWKTQACLENPTRSSHHGVCFVTWHANITCDRCTIVHVNSKYITHKQHRHGSW